MTLNEFRNSAAGKKADVLGIGVSNKPLIDFLLSCGMKVCARDRKSPQALGETSAELESKGVVLITGDGYLKVVLADIWLNLNNLHCGETRALRARPAVTNDCQGSIGIV